MANPYEKYVEKPKENPYAQYAPNDKGMVRQAAEAMAEGLPGRFGVNVVRGAAQLPGFPVEAIVGGGNFVRRQLGIPETKLEDTVAKDWGSQGWLKAFESVAGKANLPAPASEIERITDKAGQFVGGSLPFGPAGVVPALTATAGSEVGRATDEAGLTGGYGETIGAVAGGVAPGLVRGTLTSGPRGAPTNSELKGLAKQAYNVAENAGDIVSPPELQNLANTVKSELAQFGYLPALQPRVKAALDELDNISQGHITLKGLDVVRRVAKNVGESVAPSERSISNMIVEQIDDLIDGLKGGPALTMARGYWSRLRKSEMIDEAIGKADRRAASTGSGGNVDNATRQNIRAILDNPKKARLFSAKEKVLMERVVRGTTSQNALRLVGKLSPEGSGLMGAFGIGATAAAPAFGWMPSAAGFVAKHTADALTRRNVNALSETVRMGARGSHATNLDKINAAWRELNRRARLAAQSTAPALPGTLGLRSSQAP